MSTDPQAPDIVELSPLPPDRLSLVLSRGLGTVVVTVRGNLDDRGCELLDTVLADVIDGQDNEAVAVDLAKATVGPTTATMLTAAACRAREQSIRFIVKEPPQATLEALATREWGELIEIRPRADRR